MECLKIDNDKVWIALVSTCDKAVDVDDFEFSSTYVLVDDNKETLLQRVESLAWDAFVSGYVWNKRHWGDCPDFIIRCIIEDNEHTNFLEYVPYDSDYQGDYLGMLELAGKLRVKGHLPVIR